MLSVENLCYGRGRRVLFDRLGFALRPGQTLYVLGANGSGKSTLLRLLGGLLPASSGRICWDGRAIDELAGGYRREYLWLGEAGGMKPELSVAENVDYLYTLLGERPPGADAGVWERMGLRHLRSSPLGRLSSGERQRVGLTPLAGLARPLWILDEPTACLDESAATLVGQMIADHAERGGISVCATHKLPARAAAQTRYLHLSVESG